jgi:transposase
MKQTLTPRQAEALALHRAGKAPTQIAQAMDISYQRARSILHAVGVKPRRQKAPAGQAKRPPAKATSAERAQTMHTRRAQVRAILSTHPTATAREIARRLPDANGVAFATVRADARIVRQEIT